MRYVRHRMLYKTLDVCRAAARALFNALLPSLIALKAWNFIALFGINFPTVGTVSSRLSHLFGNINGASDMLGKKPCFILLILPKFEKRFNCHHLYGAY